MYLKSSRFSSKHGKPNQETHIRKASFFEHFSISFPLLGRKDSKGWTPGTSFLFRVPISPWKSAFGLASYHQYRLLKITSAARRGLVLLAAIPASLHQISPYQHVGWWIILPVAKQLVHFPQRKFVDLPERPSGSSSDMAIDKCPIGYTGTGIGSPAAAFFNPETSSTALKSALKSSKVRPPSNCSRLTS